MNITTFKPSKNPRRANCFRNSVRGSGANNIVNIGDLYK